MPRVNTALLIGVLLLVGLFHTSNALAVGLWHRGRHHHGGRRRAGLHRDLEAVALAGLDGRAADGAARVRGRARSSRPTCCKLLEGAWVPLLFGIFMVMLILTWRRGTRILANKTRKTEVPLEALLHSLEKKPPHVVPGTAVFLTSDPEFAPTALLHNLKHNKVLHEQNVILTIITADTPRVAEDERVTDRRRSSQHFMRVALRFGYMETPNVPKALAIARKLGWHFDIMSTSFFLSRRALKPAAHSGMPRWQDRLFIGLAQDPPATPPTSSRSRPGAWWKSVLR